MRPLFLDAPTPHEVGKSTSGGFITQKAPMAPKICWENIRLGEILKGLQITNSLPEFTRMMSDLYDTSSRYCKSKHKGLQQRLKLNLGFPPRTMGLSVPLIPALTPHTSWRLWFSARVTSQSSRTRPKAMGVRESQHTPGAYSRHPQNPVGWGSGVCSRVMLANSWNVRCPLCSFHM